MGVHVTHAEPIDPPIESARLTNRGKSLIVRPSVSAGRNLRTIEFVGTYVSDKFVATLDDIEQFGEALVRLAREGKAAL